MPDLRVGLGSSGEPDRRRTGAPRHARVGRPPDDRGGGGGMKAFRARSDENQRRERSKRSTPHAARKPKGDPRIAARRARAAERIAKHVCRPDCKRFRLGREEWAA